MGRSGHALCSRKEVIFLGSSWDAWIKGITAAQGIATNMIDDPAAQTAITTRYGYRAPRLSSNAAYPDNWYMKQSAAGAAAEQAAYDDQNMLMNLCRMTRWVLWWPKTSQVSVGSAPTNANLRMQSVRDLHFASARKYQTKLAYILQSAWWSYDNNSPGTWANENAFITSIVSDIADDVYLKINNAPVIGIYNNPSPTWDTTHKGRITTAVLAAGYSTPIYVNVNGDTVQAATEGDTHVTTYGPSGANPGGTHNSYGTLKTKYLSIDATTAAAGLYTVPGIIHCQDNRPRGTGVWNDPPTYTQWEQALRDRFAKTRADVSGCPEHMMHMYSVNEIDEGGCFWPTEQEIARGPNSPSYGKYIDAIMNVRAGTFPAAYDDHYHPAWIHSDLGALPAGWGLVQDLPGASGGLTGAYEYAEIQNSTNGNARTLTVALKCTRIKVYGGKRVGLGTIRFVVDGGSNNDVNQGVLTGTGYNQLLFDSGALAATAGHTLAVSRVSGTVAFDEFVATMSRP